MPSPVLSAPAIPTEPVFIRTPRDLESMFNWAKDLRKELDRFLIEVHSLGATKSLVGTRGETTVAAGFTLSVEDPIVTLTAASPVASDGTTAIKDGADGQWVILVNVGSSAITIAHGANTYLSGATGRALAQYESMFLFWSGSVWIELYR